MGIINFGSRRQRAQADSLKNELPTQPKLREELDALTASVEAGRDIDVAEDEAQDAVREATRADIRNIKLIEQGRCPSCRGRTENFLYTMICPTCGWYRRDMPEGGTSTVHLLDGQTISCQHIFRGGKDAFLCIRDGVVVAEVMRQAVQRIDHEWEPGELEQARVSALRVRGGLCSWCEKPMTEADEGGPWIDHVALGAFQERYVFCSEKCQKAFRRQYPSRVHRNCYETDCSDCDKCIKRYDTNGYRRTIVG